jgi:hypothetical protein
MGSLAWCHLSGLASSRYNTDESLLRQPFHPPLASLHRMTQSMPKPALGLVCQPSAPRHWHAAAVSGANPMSLCYAVGFPQVFSPERRRHHEVVIHPHHCILPREPGMYYVCSTYRL